MTDILTVTSHFYDFCYGADGYLKNHDRHIHGCSTWNDSLLATSQPLHSPFFEGERPVIAPTPPNFPQGHDTEDLD